MGFGVCRGVPGFVLLRPPLTRSFVTWVVAREEHGVDGGSTGTDAGSVRGAEGAILTGVRAQGGVGTMSRPDSIRGVLPLPASVSTLVAVEALESCWETFAANCWGTVIGTRNEVLLGHSSSAARGSLTTASGNAASNQGWARASSMVIRCETSGTSIARRQSQHRQEMSAGLISSAMGHF